MVRELPSLAGRASKLSWSLLSLCWEGMTWEKLGHPSQGSGPRTLELCQPNTLQRDLETRKGLPRPQVNRSRTGPACRFRLPAPYSLSIAVPVLSVLYVCGSGGLVGLRFLTMAP